MTRPKLNVGLLVTAAVIIWQGYILAGPYVLNAISTQPQPTPVEIAVPASTEAPCPENIELVKVDSKLQRLVIPNVSVGLPIVTVPLANGTWEVEESVANFAAESSPFTGEPGNSVIFGHNKLDAFRPINKLKRGDQVHVQTSTHQFTYVVKSISTTAPTNVDVLKPVEGKKELTLITCNGVFDEKRLIIKSELTDIVQLNCNTTQTL